MGVGFVAGFRLDHGLGFGQVRASLVRPAPFNVHRRRTTDGKDMQALPAVKPKVAVGCRTGIRAGGLFEPQSEPMAGEMTGG